MRDSKAEHLAKAQATGLTELSRITARAQVLMARRVIRLERAAIAMAAVAACELAAIVVLLVR